ncbi:MAG: hypothetical protein JWQ35_2653, partial [Bacteriovoracaceae bacterium]|nr:hypothetical protein [Bacteriovoracaceae bacterium]
MNLIHLCLFLSHLVSAPDEASLGQQILRQKWFELSSSDSKAYEQFKTQHYLVDIGEDAWITSLRSKTPVKDLDDLSKDVKVSSFQMREIFAKTPWNLKSWI